VLKGDLRIRFTKILDKYGGGYLPVMHTANGYWICRRKFETHEEAERYGLRAERLLKEIRNTR
jgi:hypothetical protein